jgi:3-deoxy-manno-octulosonate cytidylyltransferase (CMP-KDO synthetase)
VAEVASAEQAQVIVNIQGDEPLLDPAAIDAAVLALTSDPDVPMATLSKRIEHPGEIGNPNVVKVVTNRSGDAIYFSRCPIPYPRDGGAPL